MNPGCQRHREPTAPYRPSRPDEFTALPVSRQRKWQLRRLAEGNCGWCGKPRDVDGAMCSGCRQLRGKAPYRQAPRGRKCCYKAGQPGRCQPQEPAPKFANGLSPLAQALAMNPADVRRLTTTPLQSP